MTDASPFLVELNKDTCKRYLKVLEEANKQWFNGYNYEATDYLKLVEAMRFFENIKKQQRKKLIKEGLL